jgi:hypothetical protein
LASCMAASAVDWEKSVHTPNRRLGNNIIAPP